MILLHKIEGRISEALSQKWKCDKIKPWLKFSKEQENG